MPIKIIVTGGRTFNDRGTAALQAAPGEHIILVHGDAPGADRLAASVATRAGWMIEPHPADWRTHGRAAGPIRNQEMAEAGADLCLAFPGGRGTADMVRRAKAAGILVRHVPERKGCVA